MKKVFVVQGDDSSYIQSIFSTRTFARDYIKKAKAADQYWARDCSIIEYPIDANNTDEVFDVWQVGMLLIDGKIVEQSKEETAVLEEWFSTKVIQFGDKIPAHGNKPIVRVQSSISVDHAIQFAEEKRKEWLKKEKSAG